MNVQNQNQSNAGGLRKMKMEKQEIKNNEMAGKFTDACEALEYAHKNGIKGDITWLMASEVNEIDFQVGKQAIELLRQMKVDTYAANIDLAIEWLKNGMLMATAYEAGVVTDEYIEEKYQMYKLWSKHADVETRIKGTASAMAMYLALN